MGIMGHWYGVESLNHQSAKAIGKGMASDRVKEGLLMLDKHFEVNMSFILGLPHETIDSMRDTQKWLGAQARPGLHGDSRTGCRYRAVPQIRYRHS